MTYAELRDAIDDEIEFRYCCLDFPDTYGGDIEIDPDLFREELDLASQLRDEAESLVASGPIADAERRLECFLSPKWPDVESCRNDYKEAMN
jgi:hypothetical protein